MGLPDFIDNEQIAEKRTVLGTFPNEDIRSVTEIDLHNVTIRLNLIPFIRLENNLSYSSIY